MAAREPLRCELSARAFAPARLRYRHNYSCPITVGQGELVNPDGPEAADAIERLRAEISRLSDLLMANAKEHGRLRAEVERLEGKVEYLQWDLDDARNRDN